MRFRSLFERSQIEEDLEDELHDYLERETERQITAGVSPEEAKRLAALSLHGTERLKEECRDTRGFRWLDDIVNDARYAFRTLRKAPAFTITVIAALAFCIGANTAIFSVVDTVLFRPLPFPNQDRLVSATEGIPAMGFPVMPFSCANYLFIAAHNRLFEATATYRDSSYEISGAGQPHRVIASRITASLFQVLKIEPQLGRAFTQAEDDASKQLAVLDYGFARSLFGDPERALGRTIYLDRKPYIVIGVMPPSFSFPPRGLSFNGKAADVFFPASWTKEERADVLNNFDNNMLARLRPQVTIQQAATEVALLLKRIAENLPPDITKLIQQQIPNFSLTSQVVPFREEVTGNVRRPLLLLLASVGVLLLIGCTDIANLMFSRMVGRQREFALRAALGAGNWRLTRQTLTEGLILSLVGGSIGFCLALWALPLLIRFAPDDLPRLNEVGLNWHMMAFVVAVTLLTPLLFCFAPLLNTIRTAIANQLRGEGRTSTQGKQQRLMMSSGVVVQFSLAFLLLTTAGLLVRSFLKAAEANPGFRPEHLISAEIALPDAVYKQPAQVNSFFSRLLERLNTLPGVQQTGAISDLPMGASSQRVISIEGRTTGIGQVDTLFCIGNALQSLRIPLVRGRLLQPSDELGKQRVAVISETLAHEIWPNGDPIGGHIKFGYNKDEPWITVVGVVKDVKRRLTGTTPRRELFTTREDWVTDMQVILRTSGDPVRLDSAIRDEVKRLDPSLPVDEIKTVDQVLEKSLSAERFRTSLLGCFAIAALLLAMLGIGGLLAYNTAQRTQEFGVRIALGANRRDLLVLVLQQSLRLSGMGIAVGLLASVVVTREFSALLYDTSPHDVGTFVAVPSMLALITLAASFIPAWRAVHISPITALRAE